MKLPWLRGTAPTCLPGTITLLRIALTSTDYQRVTWLDENSLLRLECLIFKGTAYGQAEKLFLLLEPSFLAVILPLQPVTMVRTIDTVVRRENRTPSLIETSIVGETYLPILPTEAQLRKLAGRMLGILQKMVISKNIPADIRVRQYSTLLKIQRDYMPPMERLRGPCGTWIWGAAGSGKTRSVLDQIPDLYPKPATNGGMAINERKLSSSTILTDLTSSSEDTSNTGPTRTRLSPKLRVARRKFALSDSSSPPNTPLKKYGKTPPQEKPCCDVL